jgi:hypothetical protein
MRETAVRTFIIASIAVFSLCLAARANCQSVSAPSAAVYRGAQTRDTPEAGLGLTVSVYGAYDDDVLAGTTGSGSPSRPSVSSAQSGFYSALSAGLLFMHPGETVDFRSWANSAIAYYPALDNLTAIYSQVGLALSAPLGKRINVYASPYADYRPRYSLRLFPLPAIPEPDQDLAVPEQTVMPAPDLDYTAIQQESYRYGGNVGLNLSLTNRLGLGVDYGRAQSVTEAGVGEMQVQGGGAYLRYRLTQNASMKAGYSRQEARYESLDREPRLTERVNIGVDYRKPLSITRRTHLRFGAGSAVADDGRGRRRLEAIGSASLVHQMKRTWSASALYSREVGFIEGFDEPVLTDSVTAALGGLMSRRLEFSTGAGYFNGAIGFTPGAPRFDSYSAWVRVRRALNQSLAAYAEYLFYHYEFDESISRPAGLPPRYSRNGVRAGLSLWVPLLGN